MGGPDCPPCALFQACLVNADCVTGFCTEYGEWSPMFSYSYSEWGGKACLYTPTPAPSPAPTTAVPTALPSGAPTAAPTLTPSSMPTAMPSLLPTIFVAAGLEVSFECGASSVDCGTLAADQNSSALTWLAEGRSINATIAKDYAKWKVAQRVPA